MQKPWFAIGLMMAASTSGCSKSNDGNNDGSNLGNMPVVMNAGSPAPMPVDNMMNTAGSGVVMNTAGSGMVMNTAGTDGMVMNTAGTDGVMNTAGTDGNMMMEEAEDPRGKCNIDSGFPGDETCLLPPAEGEGFQIHVGPKDYNDPAEINKFRFGPGNETSECWAFHTPNTSEVYWQVFELSGRAGTHHIINTMYNTDGADGTAFTVCRDPGTGTNPDSPGNLPGASKSYMPKGKVAPENEHIGRSIPANIYSEADMHYFNFTQEDILREFWMNIYTVPKEKITMPSNQIRLMGGFSWSFAPIAMGTDQVYTYTSLPLTADGRIIALLGHYHSHGKRFTAYLNDTKVFEMYDYLDPKIFEYDSITINPEFAPESAMQAGATSGIMEVKAGDVIKWECHIINDDQPGGLRYTNEVKTGEMCNLWGESVGVLINEVVL